MFFRKKDVPMTKNTYEKLLKNIIWFHFDEATKRAKFLAAENTLGVARSWGGGGWEKRGFVIQGVKCQLCEVSKF